MCAFGREGQAIGCRQDASLVRGQTSIVHVKNNLNLLGEFCNIPEELKPDVTRGWLYNLHCQALR